jgi:hypothetical protein
MQAAVRGLSGSTPVTYVIMAHRRSFNLYTEGESHLTCTIKRIVNVTIPLVKFAPPANTDHVPYMKLLFMHVVTWIFPSLGGIQLAILNSQECNNSFKWYAQNNQRGIDPGWQIINPVFLKVR